MVTSWRAALLWLLASVCFLLGAMLAGKLEFGIGVSWAPFLLAVLLALLLFLIGSLFLVSVAASFARPKQRKP